MNLTEWMLANLPQEVINDNTNPDLAESAAAWYAVFRFARDYARTSGDSPSCQCVPCCAYRAVHTVLRCPRHCTCDDCYNAATGGGR